MRVHECVRVDPFVLALAFKACGCDYESKYGKMVHGYSVKSGLVVMPPKCNSATRYLKETRQFHLVLASVDYYCFLHSTTEGKQAIPFWEMASSPMQGGSTREKIEELQFEMQNLFCSKEKKVVDIGCINMVENMEDGTTLLGKLYGGKSISLQDLAEELHRGWQTRGNTKVEMLSKGFYKMEFENIKELEHVKANGPWWIQGFIFSVKKGKHLQNWATSQKFDLVDFWIQIHGIPSDRLNEENVRMVGKNLGKLKEVDLCYRGEFRSPVARVRVRMDIKERLLKGLDLRTELGEVFPVTFKYEKLEIFAISVAVLDMISITVNRETNTA
ncbi:hypothetical protein IFM89_016590 [Coptis chinensis]|uniref:DUF4283 domain-containing protein n=1 Tax=Coptis chinensis TaxID=261450 RepID=A0A835M078_9MAGN|nr:hypothetical protein IFM89_016590 [Coptis chinensis]